MNSPLSLVDRSALLSAARLDEELMFKLRGLNATVRFEATGEAFDFVVKGGAPVAVRDAEGDPDLRIAAPDEFWRAAFAEPDVPHGYGTLTTAFLRGLKLHGDMSAIVAAYQGAWQRLFLVLRSVVVGLPPRRSPPPILRESDTAVGRYHYVKANDVEARIYIEQAGDGPIPLLLQPTAGTDGRQYRHLLANPEMQKRFRMIAYDLPYHGKSLPPFGVRWWQQPYKPTREGLMNWVVAIADVLDLEQPFFMGCSVGGQLALDLAAFHGDRFGAFISLNGWFDRPAGASTFNNEQFRTPSISEDYPMSLILGGTSPYAPEDLAQEVYWVYRSNFPGVYAGDNDYFMHEHDLGPVVDNIDAQSKPLYVIAGEFDGAAHDKEHGGPAVASNVPGAVFRVADGLGHFAPADDPEGFSRMIIPVLDEIIAKSGRQAGFCAGDQ